MNLWSQPASHSIGVFLLCFLRIRIHPSAAPSALAGTCHDHPKYHNCPSTNLYEPMQQSEQAGNVTPGAFKPAWLAIHGAQSVNLSRRQRNAWYRADREVFDGKALFVEQQRMHLGRFIRRPFLVRY